MLKNYDVCVVFGGVSGENEVSVITGTMVCNVLKRGGKSVLPMYIDHSGRAYAGEELADISRYKGGLKGGKECSFARGGVVQFNGRGKVKAFIKTGCIINCCHGGAEEGGAIAGAAKLFNIPIASANVFESALFMDKYLTKLVLKSLGIRTAKYTYFRDIAGAIAFGEGAEYPLIVKPATLGSSIGVAAATNKEELKKALETAFALDSAVLIEEYLAPGREINCAVYMGEDGVRVSSCEEVFSSGDILSYDDKYSGGGGRAFPADLDEKTAEKIRNAAKKAYLSLGMRGIARFDFILFGGKEYLCEVNTVPGSLSQYLVSENYDKFYSVLCSLINVAYADAEREKKRTVISTGILNDITLNACKIK